MTRQIVVKSFEELAQVLDVDDLRDHQATPAPWPEPAPCPDEEPPALEGLLAELEGIGETLAAIRRRDQEARETALANLARYDQVIGQQRQAEETRKRANAVRVEAERIAGEGFAEDAKPEARGLAEIAARIEAVTFGLAQRLAGEAQDLAGRLDLERVLAERQKQEKEEKARAAEALKAERLSGALTAARSALQAGDFQEARRLLGPVANENHNHPDVASVQNIIAQRELTVKITAAEEALWQSRREFRRDAEAAVSRLTALETNGLPEPLTQQIFGQWAKACARLCQQRELFEPLRYAPDPGRGAVLARSQPDGPYLVVSALGMDPGWEAGATVDDRFVRRARPLH